MGSVEAVWRRSVFSPLPVRNAFEVTVERLADSVRLGVLPAGRRLPSERELADLLGVSRVTLREAIRVLREGGLLVTRPGRGGGTYVARSVPRFTGDGPSGAEDLADVVQLRRVLEPSAAEIAAHQSLSADDRATLRRCLDDSMHGGPGHRQADSRLHLAIAAASGNELLATAVADLQLKVDRLLGQIPVVEAAMARSDAQHRAIIAAILAGRSEQARVVMQEHVDATAALLRGFLGRLPKELDLRGQEESAQGQLT